MQIHADYYDLHRFLLIIISVNLFPKDPRYPRLLIFYFLINPPWPEATTTYENMVWLLH